MNTRTFLLHILTPFTVCLLGTLALASPLLLQERAPVTRDHKTARATRCVAERQTASRVAHSNLPSVVEQLDQIHDNYAQDVQTQAIEYRMAMTGEAGPLPSAYPYAPPKPSVDFTEEQEAAIKDGQDPWGR